MSKRRSWAQRVGAEGEAAFRLYGTRNALLPNKVDEDVGIDFFCQIEGSREDNRSALIIPKVIGVNVRATKKRSHPRIRLDRSDAQGLLQADFPVFVAFVHLDSPAGTVYHRFLDEKFALELADFLAESNESLHLTPSRCRTEATFAADLAAARDGDAPERVRVAVAERGLSQHVPQATVEVRRNREGELTVVEVGNFYDLFLRGREPNRDSVYGAIFGVPGKRMERLGKLGPNPALADPLEHLPPVVRFVGGTEDDEAGLIAEGTEYGSARLVVQRVDTATHYGWVHRAGFRITVSRSVERNGVHVHELDAGVDAYEPVRLAVTPDLWEFLEACAIGSSVHREGGDKLILPVDQINDLGRFHAYAAWLRSAIELPGWETVEEHLGLALDDESLQTVAWCAELVVNANVMAGFGFVAEDDSVRPVARELEIPVVGNLGPQAIVTWLTADGVTFERDGRLLGLRIDRVTGARVDARPRLEKAGAWPELVVGGNWPNVLISPDGYAQTETVTAEWDLEIQPAG